MDNDIRRLCQKYKETAKVRKNKQFGIYIEIMAFILLNKIYYRKTDKNIVKETTRFKLSRANITLKSILLLLHPRTRICACSTSQCNQIINKIVNLGHLWPILSISNHNIKCIKESIISDTYEGRWCSLKPCICHSSIAKKSSHRPFLIRSHFSTSSTSY